jgi:hypothetical protein
LRIRFDKAYHFFIGSNFHNICFGRNYNIVRDICKKLDNKEIKIEDEEFLDYFRHLDIHDDISYGL